MELSPVWVVTVGGDDGELRSWHSIYVYSVENRLLMSTEVVPGRCIVQLLPQVVPRKLCHLATEVTRVVSPGDRGDHLDTT